MNNDSGYYMLYAEYLCDGRHLKLKPDITCDKAIEIMKELWKNDELGFEILSLWRMPEDILIAEYECGDKVDDLTINKRINELE